MEENIMRPETLQNYSTYEAKSMEEKIKFLTETYTDALHVVCRNDHSPKSMLKKSEDIELYSMFIDQLKNETNVKNLVKRIIAFVAFCKSIKIHDKFILVFCIDLGILDKLSMSKKEFVLRFIFGIKSDAKHEEPKEKENDIPRAEGEIIAPATANRIINQHNLSNPPAVIDVVAREVDLHGQAQYADADNNTKLNYYTDTINSNILLQENFYLPESHLKNLVDMLTSPVFKQTMTEHHMVSNKFGPDFTELRHYENFDRTRYNLVLTARTTDKRRNIIITVNTANTDYIGVFTDARSVCNKSK